MSKIITEYTKCKTPHFFIYAKDKTKEEVEEINQSVVNKLEKIIPNPRFEFRSTGLGKFDYKMLMSNNEVELNQDIIDKYDELDLKSKFMINEKKGWSDDFAIAYKEIKDKLIEIHNDVNYVVDVLIEYLYEHRKTDYKVTLWESFGDVIIKNLKQNVENKLQDKIQCEVCGERIDITTNSKKYCDSCAKKKWKEQVKINMREYRKRKNVIK